MNTFYVVLNEATCNNKHFEWFEFFKVRKGCNILASQFMREQSGAYDNKTYNIKPVAVYGFRTEKESIEFCVHNNKGPAARGCGNDEFICELTGSYPDYNINEE